MEAPERVSHVGLEDLVSKWIPPELCSYCSRKTKDLPNVTRVHGEVICEECKKWGDHIFLHHTGEPKQEEKEKPSPMATDSRGLHEKYFQDG